MLVRSLLVIIKFNVTLTHCFLYPKVCHKTRNKYIWCPTLVRFWLPKEPWTASELGAGIVITLTSHDRHCRRPLQMACHDETVTHILSYRRAGRNLTKSKQTNNNNNNRWPLSQWLKMAVWKMSHITVMGVWLKGRFPEEQEYSAMLESLPGLCEPLSPAVFKHLWWKGSGTQEGWRGGASVGVLGQLYSWHLDRPSRGTCHKRTVFPIFC